MGVNIPDIHTESVKLRGEQAKRTAKMRWIVIFSLMIWPALAGAQQDARQIVVTASGNASAVPDMAVLRIGVRREARTAGEAMRMASEAAAKVLDQVSMAGIEPRDVQTSSISLYPVQDHSNGRAPVIRGYVASNDLTVRVRDLDVLGGLLDSVVSEGANTMNGLSFSMAEPGSVETEARAAAVAEARARAETLAEAAGVTLGQVQTIAEGSAVTPPRPMLRDMATMEASVPVAEGEVDISVTVTVVYAIE